MSYRRPATRRAAFLASAALGACLSTAAFAQDQAITAASQVAAAGAALDEIVVTAQKRETNLQDTPISISVMAASDLTDRHVQSLADLGDGAIPSLRVAPFFARSSALTLGMRGIGALGDANQPARDQAVGVYVDGVYLGRAQGLGAALYDVERIEVLKGPQGTLFGRNTEGGAVSIVTRKPSGKFGMNTTAGYGNYDGYKLETHVDLPAFHNVAVKLDGLVTKRDGTVINPTSTGEENFNSYDRRGFHADVLWTPTANLNIDYAYDNAYDGTTPYYVQLFAKGSLALAPMMPLQPERAEEANVGVPLQMSEGATFGHRLTTDWDLTDHLEFKTVLSYRKLKQSQYDNGATALSVYAPNGTFSRYSLAKVLQHQYSGEAQLMGKWDGLDVVGGAFYFREQVRDNAQTPNTMQFNATGTAATTLSVNLNTWPYDRASHLASESQGVFGQAVWTPEFAPVAHLTVGGRYTHDKKQGSLDVVNGALPSYVANGKSIVGVIPLDDSWNRFDPLVNLAVDLTDDVNVYGRWSTGYKSGGANSRSLTFRSFAPEHVTMYELGLKSEFWEHRARFNAAAYYGDLHDLQVDFNAIIPGNNRGTLETTNAATGKTKGFEADLTVAPLEGVTVTASYAYTDVTLSKAFNPFTNAEAAIYPLYTPKNAFSFGGAYEHPVMGATFSVHADANYADGQYTSTSDPTLSDKSFIVNGRVALTDIALQDSGATLTLALWARNLLDESHAFLRNTNSSLGVYGIYNEPRTYGVEANVRF